MHTLLQQLKEENLSCIIEHNHTLYKEKRHGIIPILRFLDEGKLHQAHVADKVIGKAAAMMMVYGNVKDVETIIISEHALAFFHQYHIPVVYETCVSYIINRKKDGMCPMEECVLHIDDMEQAYHALKKKSEALSK